MYVLKVPPLSSTFPLEGGTDSLISGIRICPDVGGDIAQPTSVNIVTYVGQCRDLCRYIERPTLIDLLNGILVQ